MASPLIHHRFELQATASPSSLAGACGVQSLTYSQLNERANGLARRLIATGVRPKEIVALWGARSLDMLVGLIAVVKAGGAFLPLDPAYPVERLSWMLNDAAARILVVPSGDEVPPAIESVTLIHATSGPDLQSPDATNLESFADSSDLAYVIYTSGSTGRPKGVMIEHGAVVNTLDDINERYAVGARDRVLCLSSFAFDLSVYDVFGVLGAGGAVILPTDDEAREPVAWAKLLRRQNVTLWNTVPALMEMMVAHAEMSDRSALAPLRLALLSGDWIPVSLPDRIRALNPALDVNSLGGATEASIWSIHYPIGGVDPTWSSIPYGRALKNQEMYVLDDERAPCPPGTIGEIYIGGHGVARGYLNRPDLTAQRFLADPFNNDGGRLYRTGDLGRLLPDGQIEFLGRIDNQVKIKGYRIELGEIEASLARHPQIRDVAVVAPHDAAGHRRLVAFFVPAKSPWPTENELRSYLAIHLPAYMIPSRFAALSTMPLTSNRKVDRQALLTNLRADADGEFTAPRDDVERRLATIWEAVFDLEAADRHDDFFALGGDSLLAVSLLARVDREFDSTLQLTDLVQHPTIADLAARLRDGIEPRAPLRAVKIQPGGSRPPLFFAPCVYGNLMTIRNLAARLDVEQPVYGLQPIGVDGHGTPHDTIEDLAEHYWQQIRRVQPQGPYYLSGYSLGGTVAHEMARRLTAAGEKVQLLVLFDAPFRSRPTVVQLAVQFAQRCAALLAAIKSQLGGTAAPLETIPPETVMVAAHIRALSKYRARAYDGATIIFRCLERSHGSKRMVDSWTQDWKRPGLVDRETPVVWTPGDHDTMFAVPHVDLLAEHVQRHLEAATGPGGCSSSTVPRRVTAQ
jgi:amino acid adenylation domain-containing protein